MVNIALLHILSHITVAIVCVMKVTVVVYVVGRAKTNGPLLGTF